MDIKRLIFNGHGVSIPINHYITTNGKQEYISDKFTLKPNQYVIMYKWMCVLSGSSDIQTHLWNLFKTKTPQEFVEGIMKIVKPNTGEQIFEWYGSCDKNTVCPNLQLSTESNDSEKKDKIFYYLYPRYGLFDLKDSINYDDVQKIHTGLKLDAKVKESNIIEYFPYPKVPAHISTEQELELYVADFFEKNPLLQLQNDLIFPQQIQIDYLNEYVQTLGDTPFILFCNVCRETDDINYKYNYIRSNPLPSLILELSKPCEPIKKQEGKPSKIKITDSSGNPISFNDKYLKYKAKYLELKNKLNT